MEAVVAPKAVSASAPIADVGQFVASFPQLWAEAVECQLQDRTFAAYKLMKKLDRSVTLHRQHAATYPGDVQAQLLTIDATWNLPDNVERYRKAKLEKQEVSQLMRKLENNDGWEMVGEYESGNVQVFYRHEDGTPVHSIKMHGTIDCSIVKLMAVMNEYSLYSTWIPLLKEVRLVKQISRYRKIMYLSANPPWPISSRDILLYGYGVDNLEKDRAIIMIRSVNEGDIEPELFVPPGKHVRAEVQYTGVLVQVLGPNKTRLTMISNADPKLSYIPYSLINWATKVLSYQMWSTMVQHARTVDSPGSPYAPLIAANPAFYNDIQAKLDSYFAGGASPPQQQLQQMHLQPTTPREGSLASSSDDEEHVDATGAATTTKKKRRSRLLQRLSRHHHEGEVAAALADGAAAPAAVAPAVYVPEAVAVSQGGETVVPIMASTSPTSAPVVVHYD